MKRGFFLRYPEGFIFLPLAWLSASALILSVLSGIFLSFHYFYFQPLESLLKVITFVPSGKYLRALHYFSSQVALIALFLHLLDSIYKKFYLLKDKISWFFLVLSFFILLFITFTGYILRADETGELAGRIAENLILSLPILGDPLNRIFFAIDEAGLLRVYHWHLFLSFFLLTGIFLFHIKIRALFNWKRSFYFWIIVPFPFLFEFPLKVFEGYSARGPWFFVGAQEMLKFFPPLLVFFWLLIIFAIFQSFSYFPKRHELLTYLLVFYLFTYFVFTFLFFIS
mgnify:CR=1 FL=1